MPLTSHDLIFVGLTAFAAFVGARLASRGKSDAAEIAHLEPKIDRVLSHLGLTGYDTPAANAPVVGSGGTYSVTISEEIVSELRRGRKIEAIRLYRDQHQVGLKEAKDAIDRLEQTLR